MTTGLHVSARRALGGVIIGVTTMWAVCAQAQQTVVMRTYPTGTHSRNVRTLDDLAGWTSSSGTNRVARRCQIAGNSSVTHGTLLAVRIPDVGEVSVQLVMPLGAVPLGSFMAGADLDAGDALVGGWSRTADVTQRSTGRVALYLSKSDGFPSVALGENASLVQQSECQLDGGSPAEPSVRRAVVRGLGDDEMEYTLTSVPILPGLWMKIVGIAGTDSATRKAVWEAVSSLRVVAK